MGRINQTGQIGNLQPIIITLIIVGVLIGAGFFIFGEFLTELDNEPFTRTNETGAFINQSGYTLLGTATPGSSGFSISQIRNDTGTVIAVGNYTLSDAGVLTNATATVWVDVQVDYDYTGGEDAYEQLNATIDAVQTVPDLLPLIVLIAMVVVILGLVFTIPGLSKGGA